jgi:competence protein ComEC
MKYPLFAFAISLSIGILIAQLSDSLPFVLFTAIAVVLLTFIYLYRFPKQKFLIIGLTVFYMIGSIESICALKINQSRFNEYNGKLIYIQGTLDSEPDIRDTKINYIIEVESVTLNGTTHNQSGKILLSTLKSETGGILQYGSKIRFQCQLNLPSGRRNPGGFDYNKYLAKSGISATAFTKSYNIEILEATSGNILKRVGLSLRHSIVNVIDRSLPKEQAGLLNGMLIGYTDGLSEDVQNAFSDSGLSHIMAVSGANVAFIIIPLIFLFKKLRFNQKASNIFIMFVLLLFVFITGFSPAVLRAVLMGELMLVGRLIRRETDIFSSIALAAIILLVSNPFNLFDIGFQLSFAATLSLVLFYNNLKRMLSCKFIPVVIVDVLAATLAAQIGTIPITAFYFNKISLISFVSNIFVVSVVEIITILGCIMAILGHLSITLSQFIGYINYNFLSFVLFVTKTSSRVPFAVLKVVTPSFLAITTFYAASIFMLWYKPLVNLKLKKRYYAVALCTIVILMLLGNFWPRNLEIAFIDVGEGDSTLIRTSSGKTVLIDGGGGSKTDASSNAGESTVIPFLLDYGVSRIDVVIATHGHDDHIKGLVPIIKDIDVGILVVPDISEMKELEPLMDLAHKKNISVKKCDIGESIELDKETKLNVLHPYKGLEIDKSSLNNGSLVLKLVYKNTSVLFTGDIQKEIEDQLIKEKADLAADVIKIAHHGSAYSTTIDFIQLVKPSAAIISVGRNNFGHPSPDILQRLKGKGIQIFRTDESGGVILSTNGEKIEINETIRTR